VALNLAARRGVGHGSPQASPGARGRRALSVTTAAPARPLSSNFKHAGTPWEVGLSEGKGGGDQQTLVLNGLRDRITVQVDGAMKTGRDRGDRRVASVTRRYGFATAPIVGGRLRHEAGCTWTHAGRGGHPGTRDCASAHRQAEFVENFFGRGQGGSGSGELGFTHHGRRHRPRRGAGHKDTTRRRALEDQRPGPNAESSRTPESRYESAKRTGPRKKTPGTTAWHR